MQTSSIVNAQFQVERNNYEIFIKISRTTESKINTEKCF